MTWNLIIVFSIYFWGDNSTPFWKILTLLQVYKSLLLLLTTQSLPKLIVVWSWVTLQLAAVLTSYLFKDHQNPGREGRRSDESLFQTLLYICSEDLGHYLCLWMEVFRCYMAHSIRSLVQSHSWGEGWYDSSSYLVVIKTGLHAPGKNIGTKAAAMCPVDNLGVAFGEKVPYLCLWGLATWILNQVGQEITENVVLTIKYHLSSHL